MRLLLVTLALCACTGAEPDDVDTDTDLPLPIWPDPTITASEPLDGATISGETMHVVVTTANFKLTRKDEVVWSLPTPLGLLTSVAYAHVVGDEPNGYIAYKVDGVALAETIETDVMLPVSALAPGQHALLVELHYPDGDTFYPPALDQVAFTYAP